MRVRILLVEDEAGDIELIRHHLLEEDPAFYIAVARTGEESVEMAVNEVFDVVIMDTMLPGIDGFESCRRIKQHNPAVKVIIQTGCTAAVDSQKARQAGADEYVAKGPRFESLLEALRSLLS